MTCLFGKFGINRPIRFIFELFEIALAALGLFQIVQKRNSGLLIPNYPLSHIITSTNCIKCNNLFAHISR